MIEKLAASGRVALRGAHTARPDARGAGTDLALDVDAARDERMVVAVRHPSGAITFHPPVETERRGGARAGATHRFSVALTAGPVESALRGEAGPAVRVFILKVAATAAGKALPALAAIWERSEWKRRGLVEGWTAPTREALAGLQPLPPADLGRLGAPPERNLLLLHGAFSHAEAAFPGLASTSGAGGQDFWSAVRPLYGDRIFAFNHFTVSRTPEENARMLLEALPDRPTRFDCITHSRGGLVLRTLVERREQLGAPANRFQLGRAALVASPNQGTALASPRHFGTLLNWLANLDEILRDNSCPFVLDLVAEGLGWLAGHVAGALPGVAAMDPNGAVIAALESAPNPPADAYSALVSNFEPDGNLLLRMADAGVDSFFQTANDLVVPTEGGWRVGDGSGSGIAGARIGCFGNGGNETAAAVPHTGFFGRPETIDFLVRALGGDAQPLAPMEPAGHLPYGVRRRGAIAAAQAAGAAAGAAPQPPRERIPAPLERTRAPEGAGDEIFRLAILPPNQGEEHTHLLASFRNAQVLGKIGRRGGEAGKLWQEIIAEQERIRACVDGTSDKDMPQGDELIALGEKLFQVLFPDDVRRLYDVARAEQSGRRLNVVLTSMIDWMADKPWEFAFDPCRRNFLAVEDVNFIRNVLTAIPAERIVPRAGRLRILVVVAQPLGMAHLSAEEETEVIRKGFHHLLEQGLAEVDVLLDATPDALHRELESAERPVDVLHFIGHGEYKPDVNLGYLLFENEQGGVQRLDAQVLRQIVCRRDIRLVFLNSCDSGRGGRADFNRGVAPALVAGGVPVVVANQYPVLDTSATSFARHFYWALAQGHAVGDAAREARVAVNYSIAGEAIDWAVPVVYARDPADVLCEPEQRADVRSEEAARVSANRSRRAAAPRARLVGLWDVNRVLPDLDRIAATLSACQEQFQFQAVSFSAPLGTWRPQQDGGGTCLRADKIARRLGSKPEELGVDMLIAITTLPVSDEKGRMVHTWHAAGIAILSVRGVLERLHPPLLTLERTVANAAAAIVGGLSSSARHSRTCPYFDSGSSEIESMAGRLKLCEPCRKKIGDAAVRKAVESILGAY